MLSQRRLLIYKRLINLLKTMLTNSTTKNKGINCLEKVGRICILLVEVRNYFDGSPLIYVYYCMDRKDFTGITNLSMAMKYDNN